MSWKITVPVCLGILVITVILVEVIFATEPAAQRSGATKKTAMLVETIAVEHGDFNPSIIALGTVRPAREIVVRPRVGGEVIARHEQLEPGAVINADTTLVELDATDYDLALALRQSAVAEAEAELAVERGRRHVAQQDYQAFAEELPDERKALALREPQLQMAEAMLRAAQSASQQAELDLARTKVSAPFDALVLERMVDVGSQVGAGDALAHVVAVDAYWVEASVPLVKLPWVDLPHGDVSGAAVTLRNRSAWPPGVVRAGSVIRMIGELTEQTRMARVLIRVADPLALGDDEDGPRLVLGELVQVNIQGRQLSDVVRLPRQYLRKNNTVWTMVDHALHIAEVSVAFSDEEYVYINAGLANDARVVVTNLSTVVEGAALRLPGEVDAPAEPQPNGEGQ